MFHLRHSRSRLVSLLHVAPVPCGQRVLEAVRDDPGLDSQLQIEVLPSVNELLGVDADLLQKVLEHPAAARGNEEIHQLSSRDCVCAHLCVCVSDSASPPEQEGQQGSSQVQPLVAVVISVVQLSSAQSSKQQPVYHVAAMHNDTNSHTTTRSYTDNIKVNSCQKEGLKAQEVMLLI